VKGSMAFFLKCPRTSCKGCAKLKWKDTSVVLRDGSAFLTAKQLNDLRESLMQHYHSKGGDCIEGDEDSVWHVIESVRPSAWTYEGNECPCETPSPQEQQAFAAARAPAASAAASAPSAPSGLTAAPKASSSRSRRADQIVRIRSRSRSRSGRGTAAAAAAAAVAAPQHDANHAVLRNILHQVEFLGRMMARLMLQHERRDRPDRDRRQDRHDRRRHPSDDHHDRRHPPDDYEEDY